MGKLTEEEKNHEVSLCIKIPALNCRLYETGRMPQGCAAAHCWGQGVGIGEYPLYPLRIMIQGENADIVHLNLYRYGFF